MWCRPSLLKSRCPLHKQNKILFRNAMTTLIECFKICFFHLFIFCWFKMFFATSLVCSRVFLSAKSLENLNLCNSRANYYQNINRIVIKAMWWFDGGSKKRIFTKQLLNIIQHLKCLSLIYLWYFIKTTTCIFLHWVFFARWRDRCRWRL